MNELEARYRVQSAVKNWVDQFMVQSNVPASMMEDALSKVLCELKDKAMEEFIISVSAPSVPKEEEKEEE